jgi:hypothetical protein
MPGIITSAENNFGHDIVEDKWWPRTSDPRPLHWKDDNYKKIVPTTPEGWFTAASKQLNQGTVQNNNCISMILIIVS